MIPELIRRSSSRTGPPVFQATPEQLATLSQMLTSMSGRTQAAQEPGLCAISHYDNDLNIHFLRVVFDRHTYTSESATLVYKSS